jgi:hypothetical protein
MNILKDKWDSPLEYVISLFNVFCNTNITTKKFKLYSILTKKFEKQHKCSLQFPLPKFLKIPKNQKEHSHLIVDQLNVTQKYIYKYIYIYIYI